LGIHSGTDYYDCTSAFANHVQRLLDGYFGGLIVLDTPFIDHTKQDIYAYCRVKEVPVALTYSCERNRKVPCGECLSCRERTSYDIG
jgi:7-cyano-7-deazaguanine synthase